ncbi:transglutaminase-like domain-containing protein [Streptomyces sp. NPDC001315]|uniref:transglutaminase-like domain-containing protein n=1 Tax=Streptomyces sp. NPDC001315 TaxID=3364562 RepID=UPI00369CB905
MDDIYLEQTAYSDPGDLDVSGLPRDPGQLAQLVRNLIIHRAESGRLGHPIPEDRQHDDPDSRYVGELLRILRERGDGPLTEERAYDERFAGTCRDFSLLLCGLLRATGTPARIRCGFADYFTEGYHDDHWVTEYRLPDGSRRLADAQVLHPSYEIPFDPLDVPRDRFLVAGDAWRACRAGKADAKTFGVWGYDGFDGLWYIGSNVRLDLAAVNRVELLPWDFWGREIHADAELMDEDLALLDEIAAARTDDDFRRLYADPRLTVPQEIQSYISRTGYLGLRTVSLSAPPA